MAELKKWMQDSLAQIDPCKKLYPNFDEGAEFLTKIFTATEQYASCLSVSTLKKGCSDLESQIDSFQKSFKDDQSVKLRPEVDYPEFKKFFTMLIGEVKNFNPSLGKVLDKVVATIDLVDSKDRSDGLFTIDDLNVIRSKVIAETGLGEDLATFLFYFSQASLYRSKYDCLLSKIDTTYYEGGNCPVCASEPHFGQLRVSDGAKEMECWLCGIRWVHSRVKCPYCDNEERESLGYFNLEGNEFCRINFCRLCKKYYKIIDARKIGPDGLLALTVHNMATLQYDQLAVKEGFTPGSGLIWVNASEV